jgi:hypothetical protein
MAKSHSNQVPLIRRGAAVNKAFSPVQNSQVVDEMNVPCPGGNFKLCCFCNDFDGV